MNTFSAPRQPHPINRIITLVVGFSIAFLALTAVANGQIDGFTEPFRKIDLSSDETGSIAELLVEEAQLVREGDPVARLDSRVQELQLEIADHLAKTTSQLVAAEETYNKRLAISKKLVELKSDGHASRSEIIRSQMELSIAKAKLLSAHEEVAVREIERRRAAVQLERRTIFAPFDGVVAKIHSREGEFLSPLRPEVVTLVQVDRLIATFAVPSSQISSFEIGKEFNILMSEGRTVLGTVQSIGVETDAQSGTVEVKLVIENPEFQNRSGEICTLNI
jgi:membrane fusion protein (multidrug efflux system)